jgi:hypothetical protein
MDEGGVAEGEEDLSKRGIEMEFPFVIYNFLGF